MPGLNSFYNINNLEYCYSFLILLGLNARVFKSLGEVPSRSCSKILPVGGARLQIERSGFEPWPGTLCCVLGQDT